MKWICGLFILKSFLIFSQEKVSDSTFVAVDSLYREDQFYFGVTYNQLIDSPKGFSQNGLSTGFSVGFLRDMPINKSRTFGFAAGIGVSFYKYHQNLFVSKIGNQYTYDILVNTNYDRNKLEQLFIDVPLEIRWRTSDPNTTKFFRFYSGIKLSYLVFNKTKFVGDSTTTLYQNPDFNNFQYGPYLSLGWNTWNVHAYYGLNPIFKSATVGNEPIEMTTLNLGFIFYIL
jgi:hypothetical protein